ncbi:MAG TPA: helix-turn-helix domain-containing protein [Stellaceae bacterium]|nr:helix-turn-helix domain-containing protein [Stellaceae bacterium]
MYRQPAVLPHATVSGGWPHAGSEIARSGQLDALIALERIGARMRFARDQEIYAEGEPGAAWFKVVSGIVRISKLLADGRRHVAEFCFAGDSFGFERAAERGFSAEAVNEVTVLRLPFAATERLIEENPVLARHLRDEMLKSLDAAQHRLLLLGRMTACERVAAFLLALAERGDTRQLDLPMSRSDIADHLGLTVETVCRVLSDFKRRRLIAAPTAHRIELVDRRALAAIAED